MARVTVYLSQPLKEVEERKLHRKICRAFPERKIKLLREHSYYKKLVVETDGELDPDELRRAVEQAGYAFAGCETNGSVGTAVNTVPASADSYPVKTEQELLHGFQCAQMPATDIMQSHYYGWTVFFSLLGIGVFLLMLVLPALTAIIRILACVAVGVAVLLVSLRFVKRDELTPVGYICRKLFEVERYPWSDFSEIEIVYTNENDQLRVVLYGVCRIEVMRSFLDGGVARLRLGELDSPDLSVTGMYSVGTKEEFLEFAKKHDLPPVREIPLEASATATQTNIGKEETPIDDQ